MSLLAINARVDLAQLRGQARNTLSLADRWPVERYGPWGKPKMRIGSLRGFHGFWEGCVRGEWLLVGLVQSYTPMRAAAIYCDMLCG